MRRLVPALALALTAVLAAGGAADAGQPEDTTPPRIVIRYPRPGEPVPRMMPGRPQFHCVDDQGTHECVGGEFEVEQLGRHDFTVTAEDHAGNTSELTVAYRVVHARCFGRRVNVYRDLGEQPTGGDDVVLAAFAGDTTLDAGRGDDRVCALHNGPNVVRGGSGDDRLRVEGLAYGGPGNDVLRGGVVGNDQFFGGPGRDRIAGGAGDDLLVGGPGTDLLNGGRGGDRLAGGRGVDVIDGGAGFDRCLPPVAGDLALSCRLP